MTTLSCPQARELVSDYIDGELPEATAAALEAHLQTCPNCPPLYASLVETLAELRTLTDPAAGAHVVDRIAAALGRAEESPGDVDPGA